MKSRKKILIMFLVICCTGMFAGCGGQAKQRTTDSTDGGVEFQEKTYELNNPTISEDDIITWDTIYFGHYWQNDTNEDGIVDENDDKEPIQWRVLSVEGDDAFLLADKSLDCKPYNDTQMDVTWKACTLREWLNGDFFTKAFTVEEQKGVRKTLVVNVDNKRYSTDGGEDTEDHVYLLSYEEVTNSVYGFLLDSDERSPTREAGKADYAEVQGAITTADAVEGKVEWWLRSPGCNSYCASCVYDNGRMNMIGDEVAADYAVRPALHLNFSAASEWSYAGKVTSKER